MFWDVWDVYRKVIWGYFCKIVGLYDFIFFRLTGIFLFIFIMFFLYVRGWENVEFLFGI